MAESTLSMGYAEYRAELGDYLGYGRTTGNWSAAQITQVQAHMDSGLRQFYSPPPLPTKPRGHQWTFLHPVTTIATVAAYSTGTVTSASAVVTLTGGTFPSWAATNGTLVVDSTEHSIASRDGDTQITLDSAPSSAFSADSYTLNHDGNYDLPDAFGSIESRFTFDAADNKYEPLRVVNEEQIRNMRQRPSADSWPRYAAIRPKATTGSAGLRFEVMFWPTPNAAYTLSYAYTALPGKLTTSLPYPLGGMLHAETILASMLAAAEQRANGEKGIMWNTFMERLGASIVIDGKATTASFLGYNGDASDRRGGYYGSNNRCRRDVLDSVTYDGTLYTG